MLTRLKNTLLVLGTSLIICVVLLVNSESSQKDAYIVSQEPGGRSVPGVYNDESARSFEPDAFCGEPGIPWVSPGWCSNVVYSEVCALKNTSVTSQSSFV